jgi:hypothetical protein
MLGLIVVELGKALYLCRNSRAQFGETFFVVVKTKYKPAVRIKI